MFNKYPYTDFNDLNLDWVIKNQIETQKKSDAAKETADNTKERVDEFFDTLDLQEEVNNKINDMNTDGTTAELLSEVIPEPVNTWLDLHITNPSNPPLDASLLLASSAAQSDTVGKRFEGVYLKNDTNNTPLREIDFTLYGSNYASPDHVIFGEMANDQTGVINKAGYQYENNRYNANGYNGHLRNKIPVEAGQSWYKSTRMVVLFYDSDTNFLSTINQNTTTFTIPDNAVWMDADVKSSDYTGLTTTRYLSRTRYSGAPDIDCDFFAGVNTLHRRGIPATKLDRSMFSISHPAYSDNSPGAPYLGLFNDNNTYSTPNIATKSYIYMPKGMGCRVKDISLSFSYVLIYNTQFLYTDLYGASIFSYGGCFVASEDCYIRLVLRKPDESSVHTEDDYKKLIDNIEFFNTLKTPFSGKKISVLGDSISTYEGYYMLPNASTYYPVSGVLTNVDALYLKKVCDYLGMVMLVNNSWLGRCAGSINDDDVPGGYQTAQINALSKDGVDPDIVFIRLGANDFNQSEPLGTYDGADAFPVDVDNFRGAYANILKTVCEKYPKATIYCCSMIIGDRNSTNTSFPEKVGGVIMRDYNNAIKDLAELFNVKYIDQWDCGITYFNVAEYMQRQTSSNGSVVWYTHPNFKGHDLMARKTIADMLSNPPIN